MQPLITRSDIAQYKQVSNTPHDDVLKAQILDAQLLDLQPLLGETLFNKVMAALEDYSDLLDGGEYDYNGETYVNRGLKMVLAYYTYARYIYFGSVIDTPFSLVEKLNENSRPVDQTQKKSIYSLNRDAAFQIWQSVQNYLIRTDNPDFNQHCKPSRRPGGMRFTKIG